MRRWAAFPWRPIQVGVSATKAGRERPDGGAFRPRRPASQRKRPDSGEASVSQVMAGRNVIVAVAHTHMALVAPFDVNVARSIVLCQRAFFQVERVYIAFGLFGNCRHESASSQ